MALPNVHVCECECACFHPSYVGQGTEGRGRGGGFMLSIMGAHDEFALRKLSNGG